MASSIPKTMKGVIIEKTGGVEVLQYKTDIPIPVPKDGEVLVKNNIIGVNYIDTYHRTGLYPLSFPAIIGQEAAAHIVSAPPESLPNPEGLKAGDEVIYMHPSAYAEYSSIPFHKLHKIPEGVDGQIAVAGYIQGLTALTIIEEAHHVKAGDWILVPAAAGGTGGILVQLLKSRGAHVIASASTPEKREYARSLGAEVVTSYEDVVATVKEHTKGEGVVAVFDGVGKATFDTALEVVARKGSVVSFGNASGAVEPLKIARLGEKNVKVSRPRVFGYIATKEELDYYLNLLWGVLKRGELKVPIHKVYPLEDVRQAHVDIESRKSTGKLLLKP